MNAKYDYVNRFQKNGLAKVELNNKVGLINERGGELLNN